MFETSETVPLSAVAPASTYVDPSSTIAGFGPFSVKTGYDELTDPESSSEPTISLTKKPAPRAKDMSISEISNLASFSSTDFEIVVTGSSMLPPSSNEANKNDFLSKSSFLS